MPRIAFVVHPTVITVLDCAVVVLVGLSLTQLGSLATPDHLVAWRTAVTAVVSLGALFLLFTALTAWTASRHHLAMERKLGEHRASEMALKESEARYRIIMDCAPEAILVVDPDDGFAFIDVNEKACQLYGGPREQLLELDAVRIGAEGRRREASTLALLAEYLAQALRGIPTTFEWTVYRLDGEPVLCEVRLVRLPAGTRWLLRASLTDIGDSKRLEEEKAKLESRVLRMEKMEAIGTLAGGIAHDFNNILACISGYTALAADKCVDDEQREDLAQVRAAARRAAELTKQILAFSRQSRVVHEPTKVGLVVGEALQLLRATIPSTIEIRSHLSSEAVVLADPAEIHRIVLNLCTNAALAMPEGGFLEVEVDDVQLDAKLVSNGQSARPGPCMRLVVKDTGCGMSEEVKARIFEPFFTTRERGTGTGMGLAVVHGIVSRLQGAISVTSTPGYGSTFTIILPAEPRLAATGELPEAAPCEGSERVLFVDDEPMVVRVAVRALGRLGYRVTPCTSSLEALDLFRTGPDDFDVVITDMTMPAMTGDRLAAAIHAIRPTIPVILCTGFSERMTAEKAMEQGIDGFAYKPVEFSDLARMVRRLRDGARASG